MTRIEELDAMIESRKDYIDKAAAGIRGGDTQRNAIFICIFEMLAEGVKELAKLNEKSRQ